MVYYVEYNALQRATGLWGLIWSHTVSSSMAWRPACWSSYGRMLIWPHRVLFPMAERVLTRHAALTNHHHSIMVTYEHIWTDMGGCGRLWVLWFRRLLMVACGYIRIHMDVYGHLCVLWFSQSYSYGHIRTHMGLYGWIWSPMGSDFRRLLTVAYRYIWAHMGEYGHLWVLWFSQATYVSIQIHTNTYR